MANRRAHILYGSLPEGVATTEISGDGSEPIEESTYFDVPEGTQWLIVSASTGDTAETPLKNVGFYAGSSPELTQQYFNTKEDTPYAEGSTLLRTEGGFVLWAVENPVPGQWKLTVFSKEDSSSFSVTACTLHKDANSNFKKDGLGSRIKKFVERYQCPTCRIAMKGVANAIIVGGAVAIGGGVFAATAPVSAPASVASAAAANIVRGIVALIVNRMAEEFIKTVLREPLTAITQKLCEVSRLCPPTQTS
jgi:hypothetical protein